MTTIAPERPEIDVKPGFAGFVALAGAVGLDLEPFQRRIVKAALGPERELLVLIARGNGKTCLQALVALHHLLTVEDAEIFCSASSRDQARILFQYAQRFARELNHPNVVQRHLELRYCPDPDEPRTFTRYLRVLPAKDRSEEIHFLNAEELQALLRASKGRFADLDRLMYLTAAMTGMRQGELVALRWRDVDWVARRIRVRQSHVRGEFGTPKSKRSSRSVPLGDQLAGELERYFQTSDWQEDDDLVFGNPMSGEPLGRSRLIARFKEARDRAKLREIRFHDLRHTFGTMMAQQGVPLRTLQEWMGHRDLSTTQIYADYAPSEREAEFVDRAFSTVQLTVQSETNSDDVTEPNRLGSATGT